MDTALKLLSDLREKKWFTEVGQPTGEPNVRIVNSWEIAIALAGHESIWGDYCLDQLQNYRAIAEANTPRSMDWDATCEQYRQQVDSLVTERVIDSGVPEQYQDAIIQHARCDILGAALELEYAGFAGLAFHYLLSQWYLRGHFPCGRTALIAPPQKLVVY